MKRRSLIELGYNKVQMKIPAEDGDIIRVFWADSAYDDKKEGYIYKGGYVYDITHNPGTSGRQVCIGLSGNGDTLWWSGKEPLINLIRRNLL